MQVLYGSGSTYTDVTYLTFRSFWRDGYLTIPPSDIDRARGMSDPLPNILKIVKIVTSEGEFIYEAGCTIRCRCSPPSFASRRELWERNGVTLSTAEDRLAWIHRHSLLPYGSMSDEYMEQLMVVRFLSPTATVLELGANIGRNTVTIATVLNDDHRFVTLECDPRSVESLLVTTGLNDLHCHVEASALSRVKLCQRGWITTPYEDSLPAGYAPVPTITFPQIETKYNLVFDTLVVDCEGALYYILRDEPTLLANIHTVIIENDFIELSHKNFVDEKFAEAGLREVYRSGLSEWTIPEVRDRFYQVFQRSQLLTPVVDSVPLYANE